MPLGDRGKVLRLLDANANRAREALRVWEDYARFVLNDREVSMAIKALRHEMSDALAEVTAEAIVFRDTPGDVGTASKVKGELSREGIGQVVIAAGKRLGEALRALEEYSKIEWPKAAAHIEAIRYKAYDIEKRLALTLRPAERFAGVRLYALLTESLCKIPWLDAAAAAIAGGADCIQLREKTIDSGEFLVRARKLVALCKEHGVVSIINDRPDITVLADADGVHVGQTDLPAVEVRRMLGERKIVGVSTHNLGQAMRAAAEGADYIGIGPVFPSTTKRRDFTVGLETAREIAREVKIPAMAIAGITPRNVDDVLAAGVRGVAVSSAIFSAADVKAATQVFRERIDAKRTIRDS